MSPTQNKLIANLLVVIGVGVCATFGAQLTPKTLQAVTIEQVKKNQESSRLVASELPSIEVEAPVERVKTWWSLSALPFTSGLCLILLGSFWARKLQHDELNREPSEHSDHSTQALKADESLALMIKTLREMDALLAQDDPKQLTVVKQALEKLQIDTIDPFVESREQLKMKLGINHFVEVFGSFSQGERKINRAWAACVDQHFAETKSSIKTALSSIESALALLSNS